MLNGVSDTINAGAAAGPLVLLALVIMLLVAVVGVGIWQIVPLLRTLADKIPQALEAIKKDVQSSNQFNAANATGIGSVAETMSVVANSVVEGQNKLSESQGKLNEHMEKLVGHFDRSVDVLSTIFSVIDQQSMQMNRLIDTTNNTRKAADETHSSVGQLRAAVGEGVGKLDKIIELLDGLKQHAEDKTQQTTVEGLLNTAISEIKGLKSTIDSIYAIPFDKKELPKTEEVKS